MKVNSDFASQFLFKVLHTSKRALEANWNRVKRLHIRSTMGCQWPSTGDPLVTRLRMCVVCARMSTTTNCHSATKSCATQNSSCRQHEVSLH